MQNTTLKDLLATGAETAPAISAPAVRRSPTADCAS